MQTINKLDEIYKKINGYDFSLINKYIDILKPLISLLKKVRFITDRFLIIDNYKLNGNISLTDSKKIVFNTQKMAELCIEFDLYQQALTLVKENITNILVLFMNENCDLFDNQDNESKDIVSQRTIAENYLFYLFDKNVNGIENTNIKNKAKFEYFINDENDKKYKALAKINHDIRDYRNAIDHANFRKNQLVVSKNYRKVCEFVNKTSDFISSLGMKF